MPLFSADVLRRIAELYGTPTYCYSLKKISSQVKKLQSALPTAQLRYAVKANPNGALLKHLATLGLGAEVITLGELERAQCAGIPSRRLLLGGPGQDATLINRALELGVGHVSLDSVSQWITWQNLLDKRADKLTFFPRVNPGLDPRTHEHLATGAATSKFGMTSQEAAGVASELATRGQLGGFHVHAGSQISSSDVYDEIFSVLTPLYEHFATAHTLDIGGGFAVPGFDLHLFAEKLTTFAGRFDLNLIIEPGRYLVADSGVLLSKVLHIKEGALKHVIADAGMADLLRPALYGAKHPIYRLGKEEDAFTFDVDGPLCENADRLGRDVELPHVAQGDLLIVEQAGAYGMAMASNYASSLRPAEVVVEGDDIRLARRRETVEDLLRLENA